MSRPDFDQVLARMEERAAVLVHVSTPEGAQAAIDEAKVIRANREAIELLAAPAIAAAHTAHKTALQARDRYTKPMAQRERELVAAATAFLAAQRAQTRAALAAAKTSGDVAAAVAIMTPPPVGLSERSTPWQWALGSLHALVIEVAEGRAPIDFLTTNDGAIGRAVRSMKEKFSVPGIKTWVEKTGTLR